MNQPLPVDLYVAAVDVEYEVKIDDELIGWATFESGAWTAYPLRGTSGTPGFDTARAAGEFLAEHY